MMTIQDYRYSAVIEEAFQLGIISHNPRKIGRELMIHGDHSTLSVGRSTCAECFRFVPPEGGDGELWGCR